MNAKGSRKSEREGLKKVIWQERGTEKGESARGKIEERRLHKR